MIVPVVVFALLALLIGLGLAFASRYFHVEGDPLADKIDALLPQTQCGQCGFPGCRPYADAVASFTAEVNNCIPGGERTVIAIADIMGVEPKEIEEGETAPVVAYIREEDCIGCTLCIKACPVDCIIGAPKQYHTIISDHCTGCALCLEPCPVDCIDIVKTPELLEHWSWPLPGTQRALLAEERRYHYETENVS